MLESGTFRNERLGGGCPGGGTALGAPTATRPHPRAQVRLRLPSVGAAPSGGARGVSVGGLRTDRAASPDRIAPSRGGQRPNVCPSGYRGRAGAPRGSYPAATGGHGRTGPRGPHLPPNLPRPIEGGAAPQPPAGSHRPPRRARRAPRRLSCVPYRHRFGSGPADRPYGSHGPEQRGPDREQKSGRTGRGGTGAGRGGTGRRGGGRDGGAGGRYGAGPPLRAPTEGSGALRGHRRC